MVVVFGGVGNLWGTLVGAMTLGVANKFLEPYAGAVLAKILVLVLHHPVHPEAPARPVRAEGPGRSRHDDRFSLPRARPQGGPFLSSPCWRRRAGAGSLNLPCRFRIRCMSDLSWR
jgi:hypothetical protein